MASRVSSTSGVSSTTRVPSTTRCLHRRSARTTSAPRSVAWKKRAENPPPEERAWEPRKEDAE